jgi:hypothetical protein
MGCFVERMSVDWLGLGLGVGFPGIQNNIDDDDDLIRPLHHSAFRPLRMFWDTVRGYYRSM